MNFLKTLLTAAAAATVVLAFRDGATGTWLRPALPAGALGGGGRDEWEEDDDEEPVLGYDGMDRDTLVDWLRDADLDPETLRRVERYERTHAGREPVLDAIADLMG